MGQLLRICGCEAADVSSVHHGCRLTHACSGNAQRSKAWPKQQQQPDPETAAFKASVKSRVRFDRWGIISRLLRADKGSCRSCGAQRSERSSRHRPRFAHVCTDGTVLRQKRFSAVTNLSVEDQPVGAILLHSRLPLLWLRSHNAQHCVGVHDNRGCQSGSGGGLKLFYKRSSFHWIHFYPLSTHAEHSCLTWLYL